MQRDNPVDVLARTIYGEARSEGLAGMQAVASVVLNRVARGRYGTGIVGVCLRPYQFSCWLKSDPNYKKLTSPSIDDKWFTECLKVAEQAVRGDLEDNTKGATHYHTTAIRPKWAAKMTYLGTIGHHKFYKES